MTDLRTWVPWKRTPKGATKGTSPPTPTDPTSLALERVRADTDRLFNRLWHQPLWPTTAFGDIDRWLGDYSEATFIPKVDLKDEKKHLLLTAELPGVERDDLHVELEPDHLRIKGEKRHEEETEDEGWYRCERSYGSFERLVPLPPDLDTDHTEANFRKGVLTIRIPKLREKKSARQLDVSVG
jgi:HSP20 family protein